MLVALPNAYGDAATNMAIDASLLRSLPKGMAAFRHYAWTEPAASFGYAQHIAEVRATIGNKLRLCRRLTGGGIVDHRNDWTYALIIQAELPAAHIAAPTLYKQVHQAIQQALAEQSISSLLAPCPHQCGESLPKSHSPAQCFVSPAANDVLRPDGMKLAGAAMKRSRHGLLLQGSLDRAALPEDFDEAHFHSTCLAALSSRLGIPQEQPEDIRYIFDGPLIQEERERFKSDAWNQKR